MSLTQFTRPYVWVLPFAHERFGYLQLPSRQITEEEWQYMIALLAVLKPGLVSDSDDGLADWEQE